MARIYVRDDKGRFAEVPGAKALNRVADLHDQAIEDEELWIQALEKSGMSRSEYEQYRDQANEELREIAAGNVEIAVSEKVLSKIIEDEEYKNIHQSGNTSAPGGKDGKSIDSYYLERRNKTEKDLFNAGEPEEAPVYGYMSRGKDYRKAPSLYGDTVIKLKKDVKERTTITNGDSLDSLYGRTYNLDNISGPLFTPAKSLERRILIVKEGRTSQDIVNYVSVSKELARVTANIRNSVKGGSSYVEAQVHGGVKLKDIDRVIFSKTPSASTMKLLDKKGIRYEIQS